MTTIANVVITPAHPIRIFFRNKHPGPNLFGSTYANCFGTSSSAIEGVIDLDKNSSGEIIVVNTMTQRRLINFWHIDMLPTFREGSKSTVFKFGGGESGMELPDF